MRDPALKAQINRLQRSVTWHLNLSRNDQHSYTLETLGSEDKLLWKMTKRVMRVRTPSPHFKGQGGVALSDCEKAEALADTLESKIQTVDDPSSRDSLKVFIWRCVHTSTCPQEKRH
jgi:hypothetical protein